MPKLEAVDYNPFEDENLESVEGNPFEPQQQPKQEASAGLSYNPLESLKNVPANAMSYGKDMLSFFRHPKESAEALGGILAGGVQAAVASDKQTPERETFRNFIDFYKERYGSPEAALNTLEEKPVDALADMSTVLMGAGGLTRLAGSAAKAGPVVAAGKAITRAGAAIEPVNAVVGGAAKVAKSAIPKGYPRKAYESAVKFNTTLSEAERAQLTQTALDAGIMPTIKGVEKLRNLITDLDNEITNALQIRTKEGQVIPTAKLYKHFGKVQTDALGDLMHEDALKAVKKVKDQLGAKIRAGKTYMTPMEVQRLKQGVYKRLKTAYASNKYDPAGVQAQKAVARAAKDALEDLFPDIKGMNKQEGEYIALLDAIERKANRISNRDNLGIVVPIKGTAGGVVGGTPGLITGLVAGVLDTPQVKAKLALVAAKLKKKGIKINPSMAAVRLGLVNVGRQTTPDDWTVTQQKVQSLTDSDLQRLMQQ